jgi:hypothetical protein
VPEYPPNSYASKTAKPVEEKEKVEKVIVGGVTRRKPSLASKFKATFIGGDSKTVGRYILTDVVIPTVKDLIFDIITQGSEKTLYGDARSSGRRTVASRIGGVAYTAYHRAAQQANTVRPDPRSTVIQQRAATRAIPVFEDIILDTRVEAEGVIDELVQLIGKYEQASITDLYDLLGEKAEYTYNLWGWQDIQGMGVDYTRGGYLLRLPPPVVLKEA